MPGVSNIIKALKGDESLLLIVPKDVCKNLGISNQDWLKFEVKNSELIIKKIGFEEIKTLTVSDGVET